MCSVESHCGCLQFKIDGAWHTWIHYDKFHELVSVRKYMHTARHSTGPPYTHTGSIILISSSPSLPTSCR